MNVRFADLGIHVFLHISVQARDLKLGRSSDSQVVVGNGGLISKSVIYHVPVYSCAWFYLRGSYNARIIV